MQVRALAYLCCENALATEPVLPKFILLCLGVLLSPEYDLIIIMFDTRRIIASMVVLVVFYDTLIIYIRPNKYFKRTCQTSR